MADPWYPIYCLVYSRLNTAPIELIFCIVLDTIYTLNTNMVLATLEMIISSNIYIFGKK